MNEASNEIAHYLEYEYAVVNDDLYGCVRQMVTIIEAEISKHFNLVGLCSFVAKLTS